MKPLFLFLLTTFILKICISQSYVYKKNPITNELQVYESQGGFPTGSPLYTIKKNIWGYLEIENLKANQDPFTKRPDYSIYKTNPYRLPIDDILKTLDALNSRYEYDNIRSNPSRAGIDIDKKTSEFIKNETNTANAFKQFYSQNTSFPKYIKDGWYEVIDIYDFQNPETGQKNSIYNQGICKVENNSIAEYYENMNLWKLRAGYVFQKKKIAVSSPISNCKATFRYDGSNEFTTVYFLDNILDSSKQSNPRFYYFSVSMPPSISSSEMLGVSVSRNKLITSEELNKLDGVGGPYFTICNAGANSSISGLTFAIRNPENSNDKFSLSVYIFRNRVSWILNNLSVQEGKHQQINLASQ